jgi:glycosyltransferase involved in cell wall biosynthesis
VRIGILLGLNPADGGIYQYSLTMLNALRECKRSFPDDEFVTFSSNSDHHLMESLRSEGWSIIPLLPATLKRRVVKLAERFVGSGPRQAVQSLMNSRSARTTEVADLDRVQYNTEMESWLRINKIDLMIYPITTSLSFESRIPYVLAVHDLQHRLQPEFPEVSANGEWESREYLFRNGIRHATMVLAESEIGKDDILTFYSENVLDPDRIRVLPLLPSSTIATAVTALEKSGTRQRYSLPDRYLFYPAQFWPHKNHRRIIEALDILRRREGLQIPIVFCGSHSGRIREKTFNETMSVATTLQVAKQTYYLGYVPDADMSGLYAGAVALVMPTFFGPTNIPVLEAWKLNCPVITSDIRGIREQAGDAALLVAPDSVEAIAEGIYRIWTDEGLRQTLIERGLARLQRFTPQDFCLRLMEIINEAKGIVQNGRALNLSRLTAEE